MSAGALVAFVQLITLLSVSGTSEKRILHPKMVYTVTAHANGYRHFVSDPFNPGLWLSSRLYTNRARISDDVIIGLQVGDRFMVDRLVRDRIYDPKLKVIIIQPKD